MGRGERRAGGAADAGAGGIGGRVAGLVLAIGLGGAPDLARGEPCVTGVPESVWAERAVGGDELALVDGRRVRLAGIEVPRAPLATGVGARAASAAALGRLARAALAEAVEGRELALFDLGADRHGRRLGHLLDIESGQWIEAGLAAAGHVRVVPSREARACAAALLAFEGEARSERRGLWGTEAFAVIAAEAPDLAGRVGEWVVVEGRVRSVGHSGARTWLNFGPDFRRDFAVVMNDKDLERFRAAGFDAQASRGRVLRVRGLLFHRDGPRIAVEMPEDIERVTR